MSFIGSSRTIQARENAQPTLPCGGSPSLLVFILQQRLDGVNNPNQSEPERAGICTGRPVANWILTIVFNHI
jgi:hypothetical protein